MTEKKTGLALLREEFPPHQISKLPKGTKAQNECDVSQKKSCAVCGGWHHPQVVHLDYVGHAALTDRLLDADPQWSWEPVAFGPDGLPVFDKSGGLWIRLTVCNTSRLGYGNAAPKAHMDVGAREKEVIGDALRNAAMRFGAALDLWHKGDLHGDDDAPATPSKTPVKAASNVLDIAEHAGMKDAKDTAELVGIMNKLSKDERAKYSEYFNIRKVELNGIS
jgi:hypothetical protein